MIAGTTTSENRYRLIESFQSGNDIKVAVLSITAANTGITLTSAQLVLFAELYWHPGVFSIFKFLNFCFSINIYDDVRNVLDERGMVI